jgi:hypothetical protein
MTDNPETDASDVPTDDQCQSAPQSNFERLITHLGKDGLAAKLVRAYAVPGDSTPAQAVNKVMADKLNELKSSYDKPKDQQD